MQAYKVRWTNKRTGTETESVVSYSHGCAIERAAQLEAEGHHNVSVFEWDSFRGEGKTMARKVVETVTCDGCAVKGEDAPGVIKLTIGPDEYDLCETHGKRFREYLAEAFGATINTARTA